MAQSAVPQYHDSDIRADTPGARSRSRRYVAEKNRRFAQYLSRENIREAEAIFLRHLRKVGLKQTEQRNTILKSFLETRDHLSTDELHRLVKKKDAHIGFTTVYRTLKLLADCGLASEVAFHDGIARYEHQYNRRSHHHMVCTECGASVEFFSPEVGELEQEIGRKHHFVTTRHTFQIYGICEECRKKSNGRRLV